MGKEKLHVTILWNDGKMTENKIKYQKTLKVYFPDGAENQYIGEKYEWGDFTNGNNIMEYRIFSKDNSEMITVKGYFAIKEIMRKVEEEEKKE